jgi:sulfide:quinone oxidoreductase
MGSSTSILVDNMLAARTDGSFTKYDGYTVAPIATDAHHLITGEFDRSGTVESSLPPFIDPLKPRCSAWALDRYALPQIYWNFILSGVSSRAKIVSARSSPSAPRCDDHPMPA